ncbi:MAG: hypothetical protein JW867_05735, partial [Candidatus Omnitrophica bacterium]|nr:hypothetical protein [Candidatus Omnitrophota bacterium]
SPNADYENSLKFFIPLAEKYKFLVLSSKEFRNGVDMNPVIQDLASLISELSKSYPIDEQKITVAGFSGGAMGAHFFAYSHPELISSVIINTGIIHESLRGKAEGYPKEKIAVFLASETDGRYQQMQKDKSFLDHLKWQTKWIEFQGGHRVAPVSAYEEAVQWIKQKDRD